MRIQTGPCTAEMAAKIVRLLLTNEHASRLWAHLFWGKSLMDGPVLVRHQCDLAAAREAGLTLRQYRHANRKSVRGPYKKRAVAS